MSQMNLSIACLSIIRTIRPQQHNALQEEDDN